MTIAANHPSPWFVDNAVVNGTRYYYVVTAVANSIESLQSDEATGLPIAPPLAPTRLSANAPKGKVQLKWTQSATPGVTHNKIYRATPYTGGFVEYTVINAGTSFVDPAVARGINYSYYVTAVNTNGTESAGSNVVTVRTK